jgi:exosortase/archaeosortase family protein
VAGAEVWVPGGAILVTPGCAGTDMLTYLLGMAVAALFLFPLPRPRWPWALAIAAVCAYGVNLTRLAILALLSAAPERGAFDYWHTSEGSQFFGVIAIGLFAVAYWRLLATQEGSTAV